MLLQRLDVVHLASMMLTHVLFQLCGRVFLNFALMVHLGVLFQAFDEQRRVLLQQVETHLKQIMVLEIVSEALFLMFCIDVA